MPAQDRTGPRGEGPMTGRGFGPCSGFGMRRGFGRGRCGGFGMGYGRRALVFEPLELTKEQEKKILEAELADLEAEKKELEEALKKIK